ncbi:MAG: FecR domain-containing protein [Desulfovibrionaceae bacterium]|nr:FecR domain-containing protein [Desulfovibrionaceae bacterium]
MTIILCLAAASALAAGSDKPAGYVQETKGQALAVRAGQSRELAAKAPVFSGDSLATLTKSSLQIMFADGAVLAMGPESIFAVDEFVNEWGQDKTFTNKMKFSYGPGVFRAVTGAISDRNPHAFSVDTPLGAIGIRGTELGSLVQAPATVNGKPYGAALAEAFAPGANAAGILAALRQAALEATPAEAHGHINGWNKRPLAFTDKMGRTVEMAVGQGVSVTRERGSSGAGPLPDALTTAVKAAPISRSAKVPGAFKNTLGDTPGSSNSNTGSTDRTTGRSGSGGHNGGNSNTGGTR